MQCPRCAFEQVDGRVECQRCGVIFAKIRHPIEGTPPAGSERLPGRLPSDPLPPEAWHPQTSLEAHPYGQPTSQTFSQLETSPYDVPRLRDRLWALCFPPTESNLVVTGGRALVWLGLLVWGWKFLRHPVDSDVVGESFMHLINLPFHEAGHVFFIPLGRFMTILGGSLGQVLMPLICLATLLIKTRDAFGASVCLWWAGQSLMDLAPYIDDARALNLILLGGYTGKESDSHDWNNILTDLGWLKYDHRIAGLAFDLGALWMISAFVWGAMVLYRQYRAARA